MPWGNKIARFSVQSSASYLLWKQDIIVKRRKTSSPAFHPPCPNAFHQELVMQQNTKVYGKKRTNLNQDIKQDILRVAILLVAS